MEWQFILAMALAVPLILFPAAFVWFLATSGVLTVIRDTRKRRVARGKLAKEEVRAR